MALTPSQLGTKTKVMPGVQLDPDEVTRNTHLGRVTPSTGVYLKQKYSAGKLLMMDGGLHRVVASEPVSMRYFFGLPCTISAVSSSSVTLKLNDNNDSGRNSLALDISAEAAIAKDLILLGSQTYRQENQIVTVSSVSGSTLGSTTGSVVAPAETIQTSRIAVGDEALILRLPKATAAGAALLDPQTIDIIEPPVSGSSIDLAVYNLTIGVSEHPFVLNRSGSATSMGTVGYQNQETVLTVVNKSVDGDEVGTGAIPTFTGLVSPSIRVFQPQGVVRFCADEVKTFNASSDKLLQSKSGWIESHISSETSPNPAFDLWIGVGEEDSPTFQCANRHSTLPLLSPAVTMVGWKYLLRPVPENELRKILKRSGSFRYESIPTAFSKQNLDGDGVSAPAGGWRDHVSEYKGRKMSLEEYKRATEQTTAQTKNILYGTTGSRASDRASNDPRNRHRGMR